MSKAPAQPAQVAPARTPQWGDPGVSERFYVQDQQISITPVNGTLTLADAGILSEIRHHINGSIVGTHGTGTNLRDVFGPGNILSNYILRAGSNTPLINVSGRALELLQIMEYPSRNWQQPADPADNMNPLANSSDYYNFPIGTSSASFTGTLREWLRIPVALKWAGMPGGHVAYLVLQNKKIANVVAPTFAVSGASSPYSIASTAYGQAPYLITGNDTVTIASGIMETWKDLHTVPANLSQMPTYGFVRYISEVQQAYSGSSFTYNFEPGGVLLRASLQFVDATAAGGMATANLASIAYQYGTNKQMDIWTPYANIHQAMDLYGRPMPQGTFIFDYYTRSRSLVDAKSTENTANMQILATFASGYTVPANSVVNVLLDKVFIVQNYLAQ